MVDDPILTLERELVNAARRRARTPPPDRVRASGALATLSVIVAVVVTVGALVLVGARAHPEHSAALSPRQQLLAILGVLRRPPTIADRQLPSWIREHSPTFDNGGVVDAGQARLATITAAGPVYIAPLTGSPPAVALVTSSSLIGGGTLARIETGSAWSLQGASCCGRPRAFRFVTVVPDGVARVSFVFASGRSQLVLDTVAVHGNVAVATVAGGPPTKPETERWLAPDGRVIKVLDSFASNP